MPYIAPKLRPLIEAAARDLASDIGRVGYEEYRSTSLEKTAGLMNFAITILLDELLPMAGTPEERYLAYNAAIGVLECVKQELYRRRVAPYEDDKRSEHGDAYSSSID